MKTMGGHYLSRRTLLKRLIHVLAGSSVAFIFSPRISFAKDETLNNFNNEILNALIYDLFPHGSLPEELYLEVSNTIIQVIKSSTTTTKLVNNGFEQLNKFSSNKNWHTLDNENRNRVLRKIESTPFFNYIRNSAINVIYRDPRVWKLVGYGGNAMAQGGYLHRGFDDISWLPSSNKNN